MRTGCPCGSDLSALRPESDCRALRRRRSLLAMEGYPGSAKQDARAVGRLAHYFVRNAVLGIGGLILMVAFFATLALTAWWIITGIIGWF